MAPPLPFPCLAADRGSITTRLPCPPIPLILPPRSSWLQVAAHNPTGVDLTDAQWDRVLALMTERRRGARRPTRTGP